MFGQSTRGVTRALLVGSGAVMALGTVAVGDDFFPPLWERFTPFTTTQAWDFGSPTSFVPDEDIFPGDGNFFNEGKPNDVPFFQPGGDANWDGNWYGGNEGGFLDFFIPNWIDKEPQKLVWIQITGSEPFVGGPPAPSVVFVVGNKDGTQFEGALVQGAAFGNGHSLEVWQLFPNPDFEFIRINIPAGTFVSEIVIDTISFPTPGAIAAFGLAGLAASRRRR